MYFIIDIVSPKCEQKIQKSQERSSFSTYFHLYPITIFNIQQNFNLKGDYLVNV